MNITQVAPGFKIIGHRGNSGNPPNLLNIENTVESFQDAWALGADGIELDAILSKDGILVVHHDDYLGRVFMMPGAQKQKLIGEYTVDELVWDTELNIEGLDLRSKGFDNRVLLETEGLYAMLPELSNVPISPGKKLFLELKFIKDVYDKNSSTDRQYLENLVKKAVQFIEEKGLVDQTYVLCFVPEALDRVRELNPNIVTAHNIYQGEASNLEKIKQLKKDFGFTIMNPPFEQATREAITNMHLAELLTYPWVWKQSPKEEIDETERLINDGANGSINNQVEAALKVRNKYSVRT